MPSYVIVGASRGIGLEFVNTLSKSKDNVVFGIVRSPETVAALNALAAAQPNVHVVKGDYTDVASLTAAADAVGKVTGGTLDVLINSGAIQFCANTFSKITEYPSPAALDADFLMGLQANALGPAHATNAFLPLLRAGPTKKVAALTSPTSDAALVARSGFGLNCFYKAAKAALNVVMADFAVALREEGFAVVAISPGVVNTFTPNPDDEPPEGLKGVCALFKKYAPEWDGRIMKPAESVRCMLEVIDRLTPEDSGATLGHHGKKEWLA
ncbi:NAD(P)-binding protein [Epithele typhae]|uniref:NAD(P)-binding protein n=1 Tax=Epithele typhae TaxID=378194 RepID=UPI002008836A|nr:NAD(P)-binding protein [Epithele typhae]KAH9939729.1 NAD(P)-binding protein [Epithele typhae]